MKSMICGVLLLGLAWSIPACTRTVTIYQRVVDPSPWWGYRNYHHDQVTIAPPEDGDLPRAETVPGEPDIGAPGKDALD